MTLPFSVVVAFQYRWLLHGFIHSNSHPAYLASLVKTLVTSTLRQQYLNEKELQPTTLIQLVTVPYWGQLYERWIKLSPG